MPPHRLHWKEDAVVGGAPANVGPEGTVELSESSLYLACSGFLGAKKGVVDERGGQRILAWSAARRGIPGGQLVDCVRGFPQVGEAQ